MSPRGGASACLDARASGSATRTQARRSCVCDEKIKGVLATIAAVAALAVGGAAIAGPSGGGDNSSPQAAEPTAQSAQPAENDSDRNDSEAPIGGSALDQASAAALAHTGGGQVTETEVGDEESYYEVEVTLDGSQVDVQLDRGFAVVGAESDGQEDGPGDH